MACLSVCVLFEPSKTYVNYNFKGHGKPQNPRNFSCLEFLIKRTFSGVIFLPDKKPNFLKIITLIRGNDVLKPGLKNGFGLFIGTE